MIARYHRKSRPNDKHAEFAALSSADQSLVRLLAGMLRVAIGLDRRHAAAVQTLRVMIDDEAMRVEPIARLGDDIDLEVYAARERSKLLASSLGIKVIIDEPAAADRDIEST